MLPKALCQWKVPINTYVHGYDQILGTYREPVTNRILSSLNTIWNFCLTKRNVSIVKPIRCTIFEFIEYHSTCFGRSFCPSPGVQDCTHSNRYMSYRLADCLLSKQSANLYDIYLMLCVQSWTPDDGQKDRPKHVEWYSINSKIVHLVGFTIEIYHDTRSHELQI